MKKIISFIVLSLILCGTTFAAEKTHLLVLLDWFANPNHAPLFVAQQQGYFDELGLKVELLGPADPSDPPKLVSAGKADIAITYQPQLIEYIDQGLPLVRVGTLIDKPLTCLVVLKDGPIKSIQDLKGQRIGYSSEGINNVMLKMMLEKHNVKLSETVPTQVHYDLTQALLTGKIAAATGMMRNFELTQLKLVNHSGLAFYPEDHGIPSYSELVFVINSKKINDVKFQRFLIALQKGIVYLRKNPEKAWKEFIKLHPELNDELNRQAWFDTLPYFTENPAQFIKQDWLNFLTFMHKNGLIKTIHPIDHYAIDLTKE